MFWKVIVCLAGLSSALTVSAHSIGQLPFTLINGKYVTTYSLTATTLSSILPDDTAPEVYTVYSLLNFSVDQNNLPVSAALKTGAVLEWHFGDGQQATGLTVQHSYPKPGSYVVNLAIRYSYDLYPQALDKILVYVVPSQDYKLPQAVITSPSTSFNQAIALDGSSSTSASSQIVSYQWDFGDGQLGHGVTVSHAFAADASDAFVVLRVTDANGLVGDTFIHLQNNSAWLTHPASFLKSFILHSSPPQKIILQGILGSVIVVLIYIVAFYLKRFF